MTSCGYPIIYLCLVAEESSLLKNAIVELYEEEKHHKSLSHDADLQHFRQQTTIVRISLN